MMKVAIKRYPKEGHCNEPNNVVFSHLCSSHVYFHRQIFLPLRYSGNTKNKPQLATAIRRATLQRRTAQRKN